MASWRERLLRPPRDARSRRRRSQHYLVPRGQHPFPDRARGHRVILVVLSRCWALASRRAVPFGLGDEGGRSCLECGASGIVAGADRVAGRWACSDAADVRVLSPSTSSSRRPSWPRQPARLRDSIPLQVRAADPAAPDRLCLAAVNAIRERRSRVAAPGCRWPRPRRHPKRSRTSAAAVGSCASNGW